jgi:hypothetical protein
MGLVLFHLKRAPHDKMSCLAMTGQPHFALRDDSLYAERVRVLWHDGIGSPRALKYLVKASFEGLFFEVVKV